MITTANTTGPRISPMFTPESMAAAKLQLWIHGMNGRVSDDREGDGGTKGRGGRLGKGAPLSREGDLYVLSQAPGPRWPRLSPRFTLITHSIEAKPLMSMSPAHVPHSRRTSRPRPDGQTRSSSSVSPGSIVGTPPDVSTFLFRNKHRSDTAVGRFARSFLCCIYIIASTRTVDTLT